MAELQLRMGEGDWRPNYEDIDWQAKRIQRLSDLGLEVVNLYFIHEDYVQQVTQENTQVALNTTDPNLDSIAICDERDGDSWCWFRDEMGDEKFEDMAGALGMYATRIQSLFPRPNIVRLYTTRQQRALEDDLAHIQDLTI